MTFTNRETDFKQYIPPSYDEGLYCPGFHKENTKVKAKYYAHLSESHIVC